MKTKIPLLKYFLVLCIFYFCLPRSVDADFVLIFFFRFLYTIFLPVRVDQVVKYYIPLRSSSPCVLNHWSFKCLRQGSGWLDCRPTMGQCGVYEQCFFGAGWNIDNFLAVL